MVETLAAAVFYSQSGPSKADIGLWSRQIKARDALLEDYFRFAEAQFLATPTSERKDAPCAAP